MLCHLLPAPVRPAWNLDEVGDLQNVDHLPLIKQPTVLLGRGNACHVVQNIAKSNFASRTSSDHGTFSFLVSAGHVRSGKTRMGIETPRLVQEVCTSLRNQLFAPPVYLKVDFLNGCKYDAVFDTNDVSPSVSLGGRLMYAFYGAAPDLKVIGRALKDIPHEEAICHIVKTILRRTPGNDSIIVPLVCHFDEHGAFTKRVSRGRELFIDMLSAIGSAATSPASPLLQMQRAGQFFIIPITTGTSQQDANFSTVSTYRICPVPVPALSFDDTKQLAKEFFRLKDVSPNDIDRVLNLPAFQVGLADTAGLPGLVEMVCSQGEIVTGSYSQHLQAAVIAYTSNADTIWTSRWPKLATLILARPAVYEETPIDGDYTVANARDSGTILFQDNEIGVSSAFYRRYNDRDQFVNPLLLKHTSISETWTWQDFEKAHVLYLSAAMSALRTELGRFPDEVVQLKHLLRNAKPKDSSHFDRNLRLPLGFSNVSYKEESSQSIPKSSTKKRVHSVDLATKTSVVMACEGTPIIDAHLNLDLGPEKELNIDENSVPVVLFIQYKHSKPDAGGVVKVSKMNASVVLLAARLKSCGWVGPEWLFLWVSNRNIEKDVDPDKRLLWVGKNELENHAPLIGRRGLVPMELERSGDE